MVIKTHRFWTQLGLVTILALTSVHVSIEETFPVLEAPLNVTSSSFYSEGGPLHSNLSSVHEHATKSTSISTNAAVTRVFKMKLLHQTVDSKVDVEKQNNSVIYRGESHEQAYSSKREGRGPHNSLSSGSAGPPNETVQTKVLLSTIRPVNFSVLSKQVVSSMSDASLHSTKKSKPYITYDEKDLPRDENGSIFLPKESPLGSGSSFDYVVPIVISMLAIPFLAILGAFFYKKACDFWDRRHYRRMDFLIDGMYND